jgi:hypothetical protein
MFKNKLPRVKLLKTNYEFRKKIITHANLRIFNLNLFYYQ